MTFAAFNDTSVSTWNYSSGLLTATSSTANFVSFGSPNQILNYTGPVTYTVNATSTGPATTSGGFVSQAMKGEIVFQHNSLTVLDVVFNGAIVTGQPDSNSTGFHADTNISGTIISYTSDPGVLVGNFVPPFSFSIALTQIPGINISGGNLADFAAVASGSFSADSLGGGAGQPTPLPEAAFSGPVLLAGLTAMYWMRRRKTA